MSRSMLYEMKRDVLGGFEHLVLASAARLKDGPFGVSRASGLAVRNEIDAKTGRNVSVGAVSNTLDRLERKGYLTSEISDRDGRRPKRYYSLTGTGAAALVEARKVIESIWQGLEVGLLPADGDGL
jgi:PadR family transcriptional regulator PadR